MARSKTAMAAAFSCSPNRCRAGNGVLRTGSPPSMASLLTLPTPCRVLISLKAYEVHRCSEMAPSGRVFRLSILAVAFGKLIEGKEKSHPGELNPKPDAYEASALPIELGWRVNCIIYYKGAVWQISLCGACEGGALSQDLVAYHTLNPLASQSGWTCPKALSRIGLYLRKWLATK